MKKNFFRWTAATASTVAALTLASCAYDPYYASPGFGGGFGGGGFGGGGFGGIDTTVFVSTGNSRWGYDPYRSCYFDYQRRCYYDPFLYGYYPVNYCPPRVTGCPRPYGWNGSGFCPPPRNVNSGYIVNYQNRLDQLRARNYAWAAEARERREVNQEIYRGNLAANQNAYRDNLAQNQANYRANQESNLERARLNQEEYRQRLQQNQQNYRDKLEENRNRQQQPQQARPNPFTRVSAPIPNQGNAFQAQREAAAARQQEFAAKQQENRARATEASSQRQAAWQQKVQEVKDKRSNR